MKCKNRNAWKKTKKRAKQIARGKKTVLNLSSRRLSDDDFILLGKGLSFCSKKNVMITLNSLKNSLNINVGYVVRSSSSSLTKIKILQKRKTPILNCHFSIKNSRHSRLLVVETFI